VKLLEFVYYFINEFIHLVRLYRQEIRYCGHLRADCEAFHPAEIFLPVKISQISS